MDISKIDKLKFVKIVRQKFASNDNQWNRTCIDP